MSLSLCAIARDEETFLPRMLESARALVDEIVLGIDRRTTDATPDIAHQYGARVFWFDWQDSFAAARNLAIASARTEWLLTMDADEVLLPEGGLAITITLGADAPLHVDGYLSVLEETSLDGELLWPPEVSSARLFRNSPDLRYLGRVHEEVRYLPDPPRTQCDVLPGGPHIRHYGLDPSVWQVRGKAERDRRLLHLRLGENPHDAVAYYYLARMARRDGRRLLARTFAKRALDCGPRTLSDDAALEMQRLA